MQHFQSMQNTKTYKQMQQLVLEKVIHITFSKICAYHYQQKQN